MSSNPSILTSKQIWFTSITLTNYFTSTPLRPSTANPRSTMTPVRVQEISQDSPTHQAIETENAQNMQLIKNRALELEIRRLELQVELEKCRASAREK